MDTNIDIGMMASGIEEQEREQSEIGLGNYGDAKVITPYNEDHYPQLITVMLGANRESKGWRAQELPLCAMIGKLCRHEEGHKDGLAIVYADMVPGQRLKNSVKSICAIGLDIDTGTPVAVIDAALKKLGCTAVRYSTHSHNKRETSINKGRILKYFPNDDVVTTEMMREFCSTEEHWDEALISSIEYVREGHTEKGIVVVVSHDPMPKNRVIVPLSQKFEIAEEGRTQAEAMAKWAKVPAALAALLGVPLDRTCTDPSRLFYLPRHPKGSTSHNTSLFGGPLFDWRSLGLDGEFDALIKEFGKTGNKSKTPEGKALGNWAKNTADGFQIVEALQDHAPDRIRGPATSGKTIECPFDEDHGNSGDASDTACYAVDAADGGNELFVIKCLHDSCRDKTMLDMLGRMVKDGWFDRSVLDDPNYDVVSRDDEVKCELVPNLCELKERIAALPKNAERELWLPVLVTVEEARLMPGDLDSARTALVDHLKLKRTVLKAELAELARSKQKNGPDKKTIAKSDFLKSLMVTAFGKNFQMPDSDIGGEVRLGLVDDRPWIISSEGTPLCTPFVYDGSVVYPDREHDRGVRVRIFDTDNKVVSAEFDAALLGRSAGNEVISTLRAKGWGFSREGREFLLGYLNAKQKPGPTVYHRPGLRDGVFVLSTGDVIAPNSVENNGVELHADSQLKGQVRNGTLGDWKVAASKVFDNGDAWHLQLGVLLGFIGPVLAYLGRDSMSIFLFSKSTKSKTTIQMMAAANWAIPSVGGGGYMVKASGTPNAQEALLQVASCAVLGNDELGRLDPKVQAQYPFQVQGGLGKNRMKSDGTQQATKKWEGVAMIASAEKSLGQILAMAGESWDAGLTARLLPVDMSDNVKLQGEAWEAAKAMLANYGHSGPEFIRAMLEIGPQAIEERLADIVTELRTQTALEHRAAHNVAYVQLVAEVAAYAQLIPDDFADRRNPGCASALMAHKLWKGYLESDTPPTDPVDRALEVFISNLHSLKASDVVNFAFRHDSRYREPLAFYSVPTDGSDKAARDGEPSYYVIPTKNLATLSGNLASVKAITRALESGGYLIRPKGKRGDETVAWAYFANLGRFPMLVLDAAKVDADPDAAPDNLSSPVSEYRNIGENISP